MEGPRALLLVCLIMALALLHNISPRYYKKKKSFSCLDVSNVLMPPKFKYPIN